MLLSQIQSLRLAAVLEDCTHQLGLLGHTLLVQMSRERGPAAEQEKARLDKLRRDCESISQQMSELCSELEEKQSFNSLLHVLEEKKKQKSDEERIRNLTMEVKERRQSLLKKQAEVRDKEEKEKMARASRIQEELFNPDPETMLQKNSELRLQMKEKEMLRAEKRLQEQLEVLQEKLNEEEKSVHEESVKFLQVQHEELQQQLQKWQQLTKQLQQEKREQLNNVCCKKTLNYDRLMEMKRRFRAMKQVVTEDREEQEKVRQQQADARAATKLQAWWRGCMVRRGLGSYKKTDESKKGKKKKKKEGKKNKK